MTDDDWRGGAVVSQPVGPEAALAHIPPAPRTPSKRARELIYKYQGSQSVVLLVGGFFLCIGIIFAIVFSGGALADLAISLSVRQVTGHVIDAELDRQVTINGRHPTLIRFRFSDDSGVERQGQSSTLDSNLAESIPGAEVPVEVSRSNLEWARVRGTTYSSFGPWGLLTLLFPGIGALLVFFAVRSNRREIRAFSDGRPILARVMSAGPDRSTKINGRHPMQVSWEFTVSGEVFSGSISCMQVTLIEDLMEKKELAVLYEPTNPAINTVWVS